MRNKWQKQIIRKTDLALGWIDLIHIKILDKRCLGRGYKEVHGQQEDAEIIKRFSFVASPRVLLISRPIAWGGWRLKEGEKGVIHTYSEKLPNRNK